MAKHKYLPGEKERSKKRRMKCIALKEKIGKTWLIYDFPVDEQFLPAEKIPSGLVEKLLDVLMKPVPYSVEGKASYCPGGLIKPPKPYFPKVFLYGCSDSVGKEDMNYLLRRERALHIKARFWPNPNKGKAEKVLWKRTMPMTLKMANDTHKGWMFSNRTEKGRAKNRGVIVWVPGLKPKVWTIAQQNAQVEKNKKNIYNMARQHIKAKPGHFGTELQEKMAICLLKRLAKGGAYDKYYDYDGITYYVDNGMAEKGITPGRGGGPFDDGTGKPILDKGQTPRPLMDPVRSAEKDMIAAIRCANGVKWVVKFAVTLVTRINAGVHHRYFTTKGLRSKSAIKMNDWIAENQSHPTSIYQCIQPNPTFP